MRINQSNVLVTGGASGLGAATVQRLVGKGARVTILDLPGSAGKDFAAEVGAQFAAADVTDTDSVEAALDIATVDGALRAVVHCAGRGATVRVVERDGTPGSLEAFEQIVRINLVGSFNVLRLAAVRMAQNEEVEEERGVVVLTASVAAYEGQIGQMPYASSKAGIVGMTIVAARDLASKKIRVNTIAPGVFDTPILSRFPQEVRDRLGSQAPHPRRLGKASEFGALAEHVIANAMINGETIRLDGALRMAPR